MWWQDTTENRMALAKSHADDLRAEAAHFQAENEPEGTVTIAVSGRHFHVGSLVIVFGRTIREDRVRHAGVRA